MLGQKKLFQRLGPGLIHAFIFWGFLVLFPTIVMALIGAVAKGATLPWLGSQGWFAFLVDLFVVLVLVGVTSAFWIRKVQRPERFKGSHLGEADLILGLIALIVLTLLLWHAALIATGLNEWPASWSPVSNAIAQVFGEGSWAEARERILVWAHVLLVVGFLAYLPHSKHLHIATAAINVWFGRTRSRGRLEPLDFTVEDESAMRFGANTIADMTWKQMIDTMSCTECGRCQDVCPAYATGKELSPKLLIMGLRDQLFSEGPNLLADPAGFEPSPLVPNAVSDDVVWDCVTCGACVQECPVAIEHVDHIVDLRRHLVMVEGRFPADGETMLRDVERSRIRGASRRRSGPTGPKGSTCACCSPATRRPRCSTGSAAPPPSTSARGRRRSRRPSCCRRRASTSRCSARASRAPAIRPAGWGTSTPSSRMPSRTSRR